MGLSVLATEIAAQFNERFGPEAAKNAFYLAQIAIGGLCVILFLKLRSRANAAGSGGSSGFAVREADVRPKVATSPPMSAGKKPGGLADARLERKAPVLLGGIRVQGAQPYEILGLSPGASETEIQKAYRERMKQYHPDKVGRPGTREWNDAQQIAEAINQAKDELLKRLRARG